MSSDCIKIPCHFYRSRKAVQAKGLGRDVYFLVLCWIAERDNDGWVAAEDLYDSGYVAWCLGCTPEQATAGLDLALSAELLRVDGNKICVVDWERDRPLTGAERTARYRTALKSKGKDSEGVFTYIMRRGDDGPFKVGISKNPESRLLQLQTGSAEKLSILHVLEGDLESELHSALADRLQGEWFAADAPIDEALEQWR